MRRQALKSTDAWQCIVTPSERDLLAPVDGIPITDAKTLMKYGFRLVRERAGRRRQRTGSFADDRLGLTGKSLTRANVTMTQSDKWMVKDNLSAVSRKISPIIDVIVLQILSLLCAGQTVATAPAARWGEVVGRVPMHRHSVRARPVGASRWHSDHRRKNAN